MKRLVSPLLLVLFLASFSLGWRSTPPDILYNPASMTLAGNRLFVSDWQTGLHVYDVTDYAAPRKVVRVPLHSNSGSAVKGDIVYANDGNQLQAIRINTDNSYTVVARIGENRDYPIDAPGIDEGYSCMCAVKTYDPSSGPQGGGGSSYATFAVIDNELYYVDGINLKVYDVSNNEKPKEVSVEHVSFTIETLYPTENYLFIGGRRGMYIFDRADPLHPRQIAQIQHARACDPVVVSGSTAYVTLRGNNGCGSTPDELLCVSIKNPATPTIVGAKPTPTPWGLAVQGSRLYLSHGDNGFSLVDVSKPDAPALVANWPGATRDFIWEGTTLFVMEDDNVAIYDVSNPLMPRLISKVEPDITL